MVPIDLVTSNQANDVAFVTVTTRNYAYRAFSLMESVAKYVPGATRVICSADGELTDRNSQEPSVLILDAQKLEIPRYPQLVFSLNPTGVCCLLKPFAVLKALELPHIRRVVYLDNDIGLFGSPTDLLEELRSHSFVVTPHHLGPLPRSAKPNESIIISYGVYNAGIFAATKCDDSIFFLNWWANWLLDPRHLRRNHGYDQIWLSYVPVFCRNSLVFRDKSYNVAFWNLAERHLSLRENRVFCDDSPLVAFHFSHFDESSPHDVLIGELVSNCPRGDATRWLAIQISNEWGRCRATKNCNSSYKFSSWADGLIIKEEERDRSCHAWDSLPTTFDPWTVDGANCIDGPFAGFKCDSAMQHREVCKRTWMDRALDISPRKVVCRLTRFYRT